jgi:hypothetical protein
MSNISSQESKPTLLARAKSALLQFLPNGHGQELSNTSGYALSKSALSGTCHEFMLPELLSESNEQLNGYHRPSSWPASTRS